jgi:hypothetical protein
MADEGDKVLLRDEVARVERMERAFIEFTSMEGPYSIRAPRAELTESAWLREQFRREMWRDIGAILLILVSLSLGVYGVLHALGVL